MKANGWSANSFTQVDANDIAASAIVGGIAGGLIGSGVGASAGVAMIASSAGTGMAVSAIGYTLAAGDDYETSEMVGSAIIGGVAGALSGGVSNILKTPLPLTSRLPVNDSGAWFVEATLKGAVNGAASGIQTALYGDPEMIPGASVAGGFLGNGLEVIPGPSWVPVAINSFVRSVAAETYVNEITDCDGTYDSSACAK